MVSKLIKVYLKEFCWVTHYWATFYSHA